MNNKKKFILANSEVFNIDTQVNPDDTLENIINNLYSLSHSDYNLEIFTYICFVNYYRENRSGSCGFKFDDNLVSIDDIKRKYKAPGLLDTYISYNPNNNFGFIFSLDYTLAEIEMMFNELLIENSCSYIQEQPTISKNLNLYSIDELEDYYKYLKLCECTLTMLEDSEFYDDNVNLLNIPSVITAVEYKLQDEYNLIDLQIESLHYIEECYTDILDEGLLNYKDLRTIRTLYMYDIYGKKSIQYIPSGNEVYNKELAFNLINDNSINIFIPKLKNMQDEVSRYYAIENNKYKIEKVTNKLNSNDLVDYFYNKDGSMFAIIYNSSK